MRPATSGTVRFNGQAPIDLTGEKSDARSRRASGIAHVPEDRQREGLIMDLRTPGKMSASAITTTRSSTVAYSWTTRL